MNPLGAKDSKLLLVLTRRFCQHGPMETSVLLQRNDPARNMQRFYALSLAPTLFGDIALMRHWGRIGTRGQIKQQFFAEPAAAQSALTALKAQKCRRGYCQLPDGNFAKPASPPSPCPPSG